MVTNMNIIKMGAMTLQMFFFANCVVIIVGNIMSVVIPIKSLK